MRKESLDELFNNLTSKITPMEESNWDEFEIHLGKKMFYKFSWNRFNIYYLSIIGLSLLTNAILLITFFSQPQSYSTVQTTKEVIMHSDSIEFKNSETLATENKQSDKDIQNKITYSKNDNTKSSNSASTLSSVEQPIRDTLNSLVFESVKKDTIKTPVAPVIVKRKSIVYVSKSDTIINVDTIKVKKRK